MSWMESIRGRAGIGEATGVPVLVNTSFNLRGEPMAASPADAWSTFQRSGIDLLVLGNHLVVKPSVR